MKIENTFWNRHFLMCNRLANEINKSESINFADLYLDRKAAEKLNLLIQVARIDRIFNCFLTADLFISKLLECNEYDFTEEYDFEFLSEISPEILNELFFKYCLIKTENEQ